MTNTDRIIAAIQAEPGISDAELRLRTGIEPHQQVNQICRRLVQRGYIRRGVRGDGRLGNFPIGHDRPASEGLTRAKRAIRTVAIEHPRSTFKPDVSGSLIVVPCSGRKTPTGYATAGRSILDVLDSSLGERLQSARRRLASTAKVDESQLLPAWRRYVGTFYTEANACFEDAKSRGIPIIIISGGYGLVCADEPIGMYDRRFSLRDWPARLLQDCLLAAAATFRVRAVFAFCAHSTDYAELVRQTSWSQHEISATVATPDMTRMSMRGGAQVFVPRAAGQAVKRFLDGTLRDGWTSTDGVPVRMEHLS